jgi:hypothetical protein
MRIVLPILICLTIAWIAITFVHPTLAQGTYDVMASKGGLRLFVLCVIAGIVFRFLRQQK